MDVGPKLVAHLSLVTSVEQTGVAKASIAARPLQSIIRPVTPAGSQEPLGLESFRLGIRVVPTT
jgi:hypothetical protein